MMEKDLNEQQLDRLIRDWTDELIAQDIDDQITDSILNFVDNDDTEMDVKDLIDFHIHQLAIKESLTKRRKWKILLTSVAAALIAILIVAAIFQTTHEHGTHYLKETLVASNTVDDNAIVINSGEAAILADSTNKMSSEAVIKEKPLIASDSNRKRNHSRKALKQTETVAELVLTEAIVEINSGLVSMVDNAKESMKMTNVSFLPEVYYSDDNESTGLDQISEGYSSQPHSGQMQRLNVIETNLINALYEIRNLNIDLNFETDNKKTEI